MNKILGIGISLLLSMVLLVAPSWAIDVSPGDRVVLQATSDLGVPLHETDSSSLIGRAPDGTIATVVDLANGDRWLQLELPDGTQRWIVEKYVDRVIAQDQGEESPVDPDIIMLPDGQDNDDSIAVDPQTILPGLSGAALRSQLATDYRVQNSLGYNRARDFMYAELDNDKGLLQGIYSGFTVRVDPSSSTPRSDAFQNNKGINAEHVWPQSKGAKGVAKSDLHHLFPARVKVNSFRSNLPFADIDDSQTTRWLLDDNELSAIPSRNIDDYSESTSSAFEPRETVKGNIARAMFYFNTIYGNQAEPGFFESQVDTLCQWNALDPVDVAEVERSHAIASRQGNENPFVLDPTLANRLYCP